MVSDKQIHCKLLYVYLMYILFVYTMSNVVCVYVRATQETVYALELCKSRLCIPV